jgi:hypothetical protein
MKRCHHDWHLESGMSFFDSRLRDVPIQLPLDFFTAGPELERFQQEAKYDL